MQLFIKSFTGQTITIECQSSNNVYDIKQKICEMEGIPPDQQRLIWGGTQLRDEYTLDHYKVPKETTFHLLLRMRGNGDMLKVN
jgi:hypothetical protein